MRLADIDLAATSGRTSLHRASPRAKLLATGLLIASVIASNNLLVVLACALATLAVVLAEGLDARRIAAMALYPAFFALAFAFAGATDVLFGTLIIAKAVTAALAVVTLAYTTPYPQMLAPLQAVLPSLVSDAFLMTYRSFFLLAEKAGRFWRAVRLRSGASLTRPASVLRLSGPVLGGVLLYSMDLAQRDYDVLRLRGYERRLKVGPSPSGSRGTDVALVTGTLVLLAVAVAWRVAYGWLNPLSWIPAAVAALGLLLGVARRAWTRKDREVA